MKMKFFCLQHLWWRSEVKSVLKERPYGFRIMMRLDVWHVRPASPWCDVDITAETAARYFVDVAAVTMYHCLVMVIQNQCECATDVSFIKSLYSQSLMWLQLAKYFSLNYISIVWMRLRAKSQVNEILLCFSVYFFLFSTEDLFLFFKKNLRICECKYQSKDVNYSVYCFFFLILIQNKEWNSIYNH